jgi:hypothetical protein
MVIVGLIILVAAVVVGTAGVLVNEGAGHALTEEFSVFGYHVTGSTGMVFLYGIVVGAIAMFGLALLLAGARRNRAARTRSAVVATEQDRIDAGSGHRDWRHPFAHHTDPADHRLAH